MILLTGIDISVMKPSGCPETWNLKLFTVIGFIAVVLDLVSPKGPEAH
jgi:hypothetical protein